MEARRIENAGGNLADSARRVPKSSPVAQNCFQSKTFCNFVEIWELSHAHKTYAIMQKVCGDMNATGPVDVADEFSSDEEESLPEDWDDLGLDANLGQMAVDELTLADMNNSQNESIDNLRSNVPFSALNVLLNSSFDAVL